MGRQRSRSSTENGLGNGETAPHPLASIGGQASTTSHHATIKLGATFRYSYGGSNALINAGVRAWVVRQPPSSRPRHPLLRFASHKPNRPESGSAALPLRRLSLGLDVISTLSIDPKRHTPPLARLHVDFITISFKQRISIICLHINPYLPT